MCQNLAHSQQRWEGGWQQFVSKMNLIKYFITLYFTISLMAIIIRQSYYYFYLVCPLKLHKNNLRYFLKSRPIDIELFIYIIFTLKPWLWLVVKFPTVTGFKTINNKKSLYFDMKTIIKYLHGFLPFSCKY